MTCSFAKRARKFALLLCALACWPLVTLAQYSEIGTIFRRLTPSQEQSLRAELAEPVPHGAMFESLRRHFTAKNLAAVRLGDAKAREEVLRQAAALLPDAAWKLDLGALLLQRGAVAEGNHWRALALRDAPGAPTGALYAAFVARDLAEQFDAAGAERLVQQARNAVASLRGVTRWAPDVVLLHRALLHAALAQSLMAQRASRYDEAIAFAREAEDHARSALGELPRLGDPSRPVLATDQALTLSRRMEAQRAARRFEDAERTFNDYVRFAGQNELSPEQMADLYLRASELRFDRRMFVDAVELARKSDAVLDGLGVSVLHPLRLERMRAMLAGWIGQGLQREPLAALERLDELAAAESTPPGPALLPFERGLLYLASDREVEAAELFGELAAASARRLGEAHFHTALIAGLQGVALWRADSRASRDEALPLLRGAVRQMMEPANAAYIENIGIRLELRNHVAETYFEALDEYDRGEAMAAVNVADWIQTGVVREAVQDSAARQAAASPELARWVREDQELRNEVRALRRYLDATGGAIDTLLPAQAARTRNRIDELEKKRTELQSRIQQRFPQYLQVSRPRPAELADIARRLAPDEVLINLLPTERAVYAWAVGADGRGLFHRQPLARIELQHLVRRLRRTLDFNEMGERLRAFDAAAARELHGALIAPLASALLGKKHLVIASSGALAEIPFAVLIGEPVEGDSRATPWLVRRFALSRQPSVTAWLALRNVERPAATAAAREPLMAWGDPTFMRTPPVRAAASLLAAAAAQSAPSASADDSAVPPRRSLFVKRDAAGNSIDTGAAEIYAQMPPLPDTRDELKAIAAALGANEATDLLFGAAATRESVLKASESGLLAKKRVVAFATHGLMAEDLPYLTQPALALAATGDEGRNPLAPLLTLDDVMSLRLNADWVVLSACNTAAADGTALEALSGLARGFFYAGARSLLVTYWAVESRSAMLLTTATFSHHVANPGVRKAESLRQAMLATMARPGLWHPAYWAAYGLIGDGGS